MKKIIILFLVLMIVGCTPKSFSEDVITTLCQSSVNINFSDINDNYQGEERLVILKSVNNNIKSIESITNIYKEIKIENEIQFEKNIPIYQNLNEMDGFNIEQRIINQNQMVYYYKIDFSKLKLLDINYNENDITGFEFHETRNAFGSLETYIENFQSYSDNYSTEKELKYRSNFCFSINQ